MILQNGVLSPHSRRRRSEQDMEIQERNVLAMLEEGTQHGVQLHSSVAAEDDADDWLCLPGGLWRCFRCVLLRDVESQACTYIVYSIVISRASNS